MLSPLLGKLLQACWLYFPVVHSIKPSIALYLTAIILILDHKKKIRLTVWICVGVLIVTCLEFCLQS